MRQHLRLCLSLLLPCTALQAEAPLRLPPVTVEAEAAAPAAGATQLDHAGQRSLDLSDLLRRAAGVELRSTGGLGAYAEASLRGSAARHVSVLFDGVPLELAGGRAINLALFPAAIVERVELYRGATPLDVGPAAAGAINLLPAPAGATRARSAHHVGSFGSWRSTAVLGGQAGLLALGAAATDNDFPLRNPFKPFDPDDPQRRREEPRRHAARDQQFGLWRGVWRPQSGQLRALIYAFAQDQQLPDRVNSPAPDTHLNSDLWLAHLQHAGPDDLRLGLSLQQLREHFIDRGSRIGLAAQDQQMQSRRLAMDASGGDMWRWHGRLSWQDFQADDRQAGSRTQVERLALDLATQRDWRPWRALVLTPALQLQHVRDRAQGVDLPADTETFLQPGLAWNWARTGTCKPGGHLAHQQRAPGFVERYGDRGYLKGNPALRAERLWRADLELACRAGPGRWRAALFTQRLRDAISFVYDAQGVGRATNTGRARIHGLELEGQFALSRRWGLSLAGTWLDAENRSSTRAARGRQLPGRTRWQAYARFDWDSAPARSSGWGAFHEFHFASGRYFDSSNLLPAPVTRLHATGLSWRHGIARLGLEGRNWLDQRHAQFNGFPRPGRSWHLSLNLNFDQGELP